MLAFDQAVGGKAAPAHDKVNLRFDRTQQVKQALLKRANLSHIVSIPSGSLKKIQVCFRSFQLTMESSTEMCCSPSIRLTSCSMSSARPGVEQMLEQEEVVVDEFQDPEFSSKKVRFRNGIFGSLFSILWMIH